MTAATRPAIGMVSTHAPTMLPATPHRTADRRRVAPTPITAEVIVWVVEIGAWKTNAVVYRTLAAVASAANPRGGSRCTMGPPSVRKRGHPPGYVPAPHAPAA